MEKEEFELLSKAYAPFITSTINNNALFYGLNETIKWGFIFNEDDSIVATCDRKTNIVKVNLQSVIRAHFGGDLYTIEYFLLHEIRHIFQHEIIKDYKDGKDVPIDEEIVKKWIYEGEHYIKIKDEKGNENPEYFNQDIELDAYAFSYAVMKYKYRNIKVYVPPYYGKDFYDIVSDWIEFFKNTQSPNNAN